MTVFLSPVGGAGAQFFDNNGELLISGKLFTYASGTTTPQTTYTSILGNVAHTNPIVLDSAGRVPGGELWLDTGNSGYKFVLVTSTDLPIATWDQISGINGTGIASNAVNVQYDPPGIGAIPITVDVKLDTLPSIINFGAVPDGLTASNDAVDLMAAQYGFVIVPYGDFSLTTLNIDVPIYFQDGGAITVPSGHDVTFKNRISASPKQQIFKGSGFVYFESDDSGSGFGEDSKHAYAAWWGIFPVGQTNVIQTALFNKALTAYTAQTREGIFDLDLGSYRIDGKVTIPRGVHFRGVGTRRTIIDLVGDGYTALESGGAAIKISGIQFEQPVGAETYFDGTQISLLHDTPVLNDVRLWNAKTGVFVGESAAGAHLLSVIGTYTVEPVGGYPANSSLIHVRADNTFIEDIRVSNTSFGPDVAILIGFGGGSQVTNTNIADINVTEKTVPVRLVADTQDIQNISISNVLFFGETGANIDAVIDIQTSGTSNVQNATMTNIVANSLATSLLKITQASSGATQSITLASGAANSSSTKAAELIRTSGILTRIVIGQPVQANQAAQPVVTTGSMSRIVIPDHLWPILTIANDSVAQVKPVVLGGLITIIDMGDGGNFPNVNTSGQILYDVGASPASLKASGGANLATLLANTVPTGTTGSVGNLSVSPVDTGTLYFENRTGGEIQVRYSFK